MLRLKQIRESRGLSRAAVADHLGISRQGYGYYESGQRTPSAAVLMRIAEYFNVSIDYLLGTSDDAVPTGVILNEENNQELREEVENLALGESITIEIGRILFKQDAELNRYILDYLKTSKNTKKALAQMIALMPKVEG